MNGKNYNKALKDYLTADSSPMNRRVKADLDTLQGKINEIGKTGSYKKSYAKEYAMNKLIGIQVQYSQDVKAYAKRFRKDAEEISKKRMDEIQRNNVAHMVRQQEASFQASLLDKKELRERLAPLLVQGSPLGEKVHDFKDYAEVMALVQAAQAANMPEVKNVKTTLKELEPVHFDYKETATFEDVARELESVNPDKVYVNTDRGAMEVFFDVLIDLDGPLSTLADY